VHEYAVTDLQWDALVELCAWLSYWSNLDSMKNIIGHWTCRWTILTVKMQVVVLDSPGDWAGRGDWQMPDPKRSPTENLPFVLLATVVAGLLASSWLLFQRLTGSRPTAHLTQRTGHHS
jgi:hypothetical protein